MSQRGVIVVCFHPKGTTNRLCTSMVPKMVHLQVYFHECTWYDLKTLTCAYKILILWTIPLVPNHKFLMVGGNNVKATSTQPKTKYLFMKWKEVPYNNNIESCKKTYTCVSNPPNHLVDVGPSKISKDGSESPKLVNLDKSKAPWM